MYKPISIPSVNIEEFGFSIHRRRAGVMQLAHRHNDIEVLSVENGSVTWMFGGAKVQVRANQLAVRWAAIPHRCISVRGRAMHISLKLPLAWLLTWQLSRPFVELLFQGNQLIDASFPGRASDVNLMRQWMQDLKTDRAEQRRIVLLEIEARLRRFALAVAERFKLANHHSDSGLVSSLGIGKVERMAAYISQHYAEPLRTSDIAESVGLHPRYAMSIFHKTLGLTMLEYLTQLRVGHAQRLLASTEAKIVQIAFDSGFGSASRFYAAFEHIVGQSPKQYRLSLRGER